MAVVVLDAGVLVAVERRTGRASAWLERLASEAADLVVPATVVAEVWRDGSRQATLARLLAACEVVAVTGDEGRAAGALLSTTGRPATLDAILVAVAARRGGVVLTADPGDIGPLAAAAGVRCLEF